jgi:hypothetical protein
MFISIALNKDNIGCDKICSGIQKLISQYSLHHPNLSDSVLFIEIRTVGDSQTYDEPLKIEYQQITS